MQEERVNTLPWLFVVEARIDPDIEDEWNRFYDDEHLPQVVACPGFLSGARWVSESEAGERRYLAVYEVEGPEVFETPEFLQATGWGKFKKYIQEDRTRLYQPRK